MTPKAQGPTPACLLALPAAGWAHAEPPAGKCRNPRATVQTLYAAVGGARENPKYIADATACLDLGALPADRPDSELLAVQLEAGLRAADVNTARIPDAAAADAHG